MDDKLKELARQAVADADPNGPGGTRGQAVKLLRDRDDKRRRMQEYIAAVNWALDYPRAAGLPVGSVVASAEYAFIKDYPTAWSQWRGTNGGHFTDAQVDDKLAAGATVLRVGTGEG